MPIHPTHLSKIKTKLAKIYSKMCLELHSKKSRKIPIKIQGNFIHGYVTEPDIINANPRPYKGQNKENFDKY